MIMQINRRASAGARLAGPQTADRQCHYAERAGESRHGKVRVPGAESDVVGDYILEKRTESANAWS